MQRHVIKSVADANGKMVEIDPLASVDLAYMQQKCAKL